MIKKKTLSDGLTVVMEVIPYVQSISMGVWVKTGAVNEITKHAGISHYIEHMLFKGTEKRNAKQIAADVDRIGGQINAFTGKETTCYYLKTLSTNLEKGMEILSDMLLNSTFDKENLSKEREVIFEEIKMIKDSPDDYVHDLISDAIFAGTPLSKSIIGTQTTLNNISQKTIQKYMKDFYSKKNIVISVAGNFNEDQVLTTIEKYFEDLPSEGNSAAYTFKEYSPNFISKVRDIEQSHICLGTKSLPMDDKRYYPLVVLNNIMGSSMSSRLFQNIREEKGLAYSVYSMNSSYTKDGYYNIYAGVGNDKVKPAIEAIKEELSLLKKDGISIDELNTAKEQLKGSYIFSQENVNGRMFSIGKSTILLDKVYSPEEVISKIDKVTMEEITELFPMITDIENYSGAIIGSKKQNLKSLIRS